jgi:hypothetical protein
MGPDSSAEIREGFIAGFKTVASPGRSEKRPTNDQTSSFARSGVGARISPAGSYPP